MSCMAFPCTNHKLDIGKPSYSSIILQVFTNLHIPTTLDYITAVYQCQILYV